VFEAFEKFGWLWTNFTPKKPILDCLKNPKYYVSVLKNELSKTFNDKKKELFTACISILEYKRNNDSQGFYFGTTHFNTVWEGLIDSAYGIPQAEKKRYFPPAKWDFVPALKTIGREYTLHPDTIMKSDNNIFVLDAKYYSFELNPNALPSAADINKQVRYGAYAHQIDENKKVYNAFLIPYDFKTNRYNLDIKDEPYAFIGKAFLLKNNDEADIDETYKQVLGILVDTKWLIQNAAKVDKAVLAEFISSSSGCAMV
jgi:hypothetical protein